jgi:hypothetical protein
MVPDQGDMACSGHKKKVRRLKRCGDPIGNRCLMIHFHLAHRILVNYQVAFIQPLLHCLGAVPSASKPETTALVILGKTMKHFFSTSITLLAPDFMLTFLPTAFPISVSNTAGSTSKNKFPSGGNIFKLVSPSI